MPPLVSVIVTTYNQSVYIGQTLQSVFAQDYEPFEVIVVNDGSTDDTEEQINPFKDRINYIYQANQGVAGSRNTGVRNARGEFVAFLDGDDIWEKNKLLLQVSGALRYPDAGMIIVNGVKFNESGQISDSLIGDTLEPLVKRCSIDGVWVGRCYRQLLHSNFIYTTSQVLIPRRVVKMIGESDGRFKTSSDYDLWLRIADRYEFMVIDRPLVRWRYHPSASGPNKKIKGLNWDRDHVAVWKKHLRLVTKEVRPVLQNQIRNTLVSAAREAYYYGRKTDRAWSIRYLFRLWLRNPESISVAVLLLGLIIPSHLTSFALGTLRKLTKCAF
jgi:glycosyltransferase involved in cell wall biosynthesis